MSVLLDRRPSPAIVEPPSFARLGITIESSSPPPVPPPPITNRSCTTPASLHRTPRYEHGGATFRLFVNGVTGDAFGIEQRSLVGEAWNAVSAVGRSMKQLEQRCECHLDTIAQHAPVAQSARRKDGWLCLAALPILTHDWTVTAV